MKVRSILRNLIISCLSRIKKPKTGIHIINSHYVTPNLVDLERDLNIFEQYLCELSKVARFITVEEAARRISERKIPKNEVLVAFTYDDGFEECYSVIAPLLERYGTRGGFFINANYIDSSQQYQNQFHERVAIDTKRPMTWLQIADLHNRGHLIGSHNLDHFNFATLSDEEIDFQLSKNKMRLEEKLNYQCEYFAWTYGQLKHFPARAIGIAQKYHKFIFSATNYKKYFSYSGQVINRRHQEAFWPKSHVKYFISYIKK